MNMIIDILYTIYIKQLVQVPLGRLAAFLQRDPSWAFILALNISWLCIKDVQIPKVLFIWIGRKEKEEVWKDIFSNCLARIRTEARAASRTHFYGSGMGQRPERML